jgi:hypothetical protein
MTIHIQKRYIPLNLLNIFIYNFLMEGMEGKINKKRYPYKAKNVYRPNMGLPPLPSILHYFNGPQKSSSDSWPVELGETL